MTLTPPGDEDPVRDSELPSLAADVKYEVAMATFAGHQLLHAEVQRTPAGHNAFIEVFLLHVRNLADFFDARPTKDDVVASHYVADWSATRDSEPRAREAQENLRSQCRWINKRLAHITATRQREPKELDARLITDVMREIAILFQLFVDNLSDEQRSWFRAGEPHDLD